MHLTKITLLFFSLGFLMGFAQENRLDFKAFGEMPQVVQRQLYTQLKNAKSIEERCKYLDMIARIFLRSGHVDSLVHYSEQLKIETLYAKLNESVLKNYRLRALYYEGVGAQKMGLMDDAITSFIQGIETSTENSLLQNYLKLELAETYILKNELDRAQPILDELSQFEGNKEFYLKMVVAKSRFLLLGKEYDLAKILINKALSESYIQGHNKIELELRLCFARIKLREGDIEGTISSCSSFKKIAIDNGYYDLYIEAALTEGLALVITKEYHIAEMALNSAYVNTIQWNRLELEKKVIKALVRLYQAKGDYKNAYNLMTQYQAISNTIIKNQNQRLVRDLELKYETLKKEKKIDKLQEDQLVKQTEIDRQKTTKYAFLIGFFVILIPIILLLVVYYQKLQAQSLLNKQQEAINQQEVESLLQAQELSLAKNAISVQRKERNRIARELHDSIGGNLAGIKLRINSLGDDRLDFKQILKQLDITYEQVREISHSLIPMAFKDSAFTELVKNYIQNLSQDSPVNLRFNTYPNEAINKLDTPLQVTLFNMIKELVTNAFKHAKASEIEIQLTFLSEEKSIELIYEDDGVGFDSSKTNKGIGLNNLEIRVKEFNGTFSINTALSKGTVITISIPQP